MLFSPSDILLWYDPSDLTTMFTDTTGTTQVAADGDSVALMLDKGQWGGKTLEQVLAAQSEMVTNGGFDADTDWTKGTGWSISGGQAIANTAGIGVGLTQAKTITSGKLYRIAYTVLNYSQGGVRFQSSSGANGLTRTANGSYVEYYRATADATSCGLFGTGFAFGGRVDNFSVKEIPGYHRVQATGTSMPKYKTDGTLHWLLYDGSDDGNVTPTIPWGTVTSDGAARRNLLSDPDKFDHTTWLKTRSSISPNVVISPNGTTTAAKLVEDGTAGNSHILGIIAGNPISSTGTYTFSVYAKKAERQNVILQISEDPASAAKRHMVNFNLDSGTIVNTLDVNSPTGTNHAIEDVGNGWYRCSVIQSISSVVRVDCTVYLYDNDGIFVNPTYNGDGSSGVYIWGAQLELGSTATDFQNIGSDEVAICAGVTKSSDAAAGAFLESSSTSASNNGTFALLSPSSAAANYFWRTKGTGTSDQTRTTYAAPTTNVLTSLGKIGDDTNRFRINVDEATVATDQGTGNFGSYVLYFGRRGGSSLPFNGREYQTVIRSRLLSAAELSSLETFVAGKTGIIL